MPTRDRYIFQGWYTARTGGVKVTPETKVTRAVTYYAYWVYGVTSYTVTFDPMWGEVTPSNRVVQSGKTVGALPVPTRPKYKFLGWYTAADGGTKISTTMKVNGNVTCYARWERVVFTTLIRFDANGGICNVTNRTVLAGGKVGDLPDAVRWGWNFKGWYTSSKDGVEISADTHVEDDVTFFARWEEVVYEYEPGKLYGTQDSGAEYANWKDMLKYAYASQTPMVFIIGWEGCSYCKLVHQSFLDSGEWDLPCLMYYDYYKWIYSGDTEEYDLFSTCQMDGRTWPSIGIYWNLGNGKIAKKHISLHNSSYGSCYEMRARTIDKEKICYIIRETLDDPYSIAVDESEDFDQELASVGDVVIEIDNLLAQKDGSVETKLEVYTNFASDELPKVSILGLPSGVKFNAKTMVISGKVAKPGDYLFTVKAECVKVKKTVTKTVLLKVPSRSCKTQLQQTAARRQRMPELRRIA